MDNVLKYTEYKKQQALFIQTKLADKYKGQNLDQFIMSLYVEYLAIYGIKDKLVFEKIKTLIRKIDDYWIKLGHPEMFNSAERYSKETHENIDKLMDDVIS
jgi:hypothetical protein